MFYLALSVTQVTWFILFFVLERIYPREKLMQEIGFVIFLGYLNLIFLLWLKFILMIIAEWPYESIICLESTSNFLLFYFIYSFLNYWWHRAKHAIPVLWKYLHYLHHYPNQMHSLVAFLRHPSEVLVNTILIVIISKIIFNFDPKAVFGALVIESMLEIFHHSNINISNRHKWIKYFIQTPDMHLVHHQKGKHKNNYSPLAIYDYIFHTWRIPEKKTSVGLKKRTDVFRHLFKF